jgi:hypothetical protein
METGLVIGIALTVATVIGAGIAILFAWRRTVDNEKLWTSVAGGLILFKYNPGQIHSPEKMRIAVNKAVTVLCTDGPWPREKVLEALHMVKIQVNPTDKWEGVVCSGNECRPGSVAGQSYVESGLVIVGLSLKGLLHELCHIAEWRIDQTVDYEHKTWASRGLTLISDSYDPFSV